MGVRIVALSGLVLLALLVKTTVLPAIAIAGARPDVLVLVVVGVALLDGPDTGLRLGFAAGLTQDLISGSATLVGLGALVLMGAGYAAGRLRPYLASSRRLGAFAAGGVIAAGVTAVYGLVGSTLDVVTASLGQILLATILVGLYSAAAGPVVLRPTQAVMRQFPVGAG